MKFLKKLIYAMYIIYQFFSYFLLKRRYVKYEAAYLVRLNRLCINEQKFPTPSSWREKKSWFYKKCPRFCSYKESKEAKGEEKTKWDQRNYEVAVDFKKLNDRDISEMPLGFQIRVG